MRDERIDFEGSTGAKLSGKVRRPAGAPRGWALLAHCFTCGKDLRAARLMTDALAIAGYGVLRFDFTGLGESEGAFAETTFLSNVADLVAAARWLERTEGTGPHLLVGHSLGGTAAIKAARQLPSVRGVATIGSPFEPGHAAGLLEPVREALHAEGEAEIELAGRTFKVGRALLDDLGQSSITEDLAELRRPLLVLHAPFDTVVEVDNARQLFEAARHPKSFVSLDKADHLLTDPTDAQWAGELVAAWARRTLDPVEPSPLAHGVVEAVVSSGLRTEIRAGYHRFAADEPQRLGGTDTGPTPYDLLLAALGACTAMTLRMYADRKQWPLEEVTVHLEHDREHVTDCAREDGAGRIDVLRRAIRVAGALSAEQRQRLMEIADRCPVHRTLEGPLEVRTVLKAQDS